MKDGKQWIAWRWGDICKLWWGVTGSVGVTQWLSLNNSTKRAAPHQSPHYNGNKLRGKWNVICSNVHKINNVLHLIGLCGLVWVGIPLDVKEFSLDFFWNSFCLFMGLELWNFLLCDFAISKGMFTHGCWFYISYNYWGFYCFGASHTSKKNL